MTSTQRLGRHRQDTTGPVRTHRFRRRTAVVAAVLVTVAAVAAGLYATGWPAAGADSVARASGRDPLPTKAGSYLGLYPEGVPASYAAARSFTTATGVSPNVVVYYSGWLEPFQASFAGTASRAGAVPLVQIDPDGVSVAAIAGGQYDDYLRSYAGAVRRYQQPGILSFGYG